MRVGCRHNIDAAPITTDGKPLLWVQEFRYLGIKLVSSKRFNVNLQESRQKFYRALNGILGKVGPDSSPLILCSLIEAYCVPILVYASECILWSNSMTKSCEKAYSQAFFKIFKTYDSNVAMQCQFYMGQLPIKFKIMNRKLNFLLQLKNLKIENCNYLVKSETESGKLIESLNIPVKNGVPFPGGWKKFLWNSFKTDIENIS